MAVPFIGKADLDNYLGRTTDLEKAKIALDSACDSIRKAAEQELDYVEGDTAVLDNVEGRDTLLLPETPVYEVTQLVGPAGALNLGSQYLLDKEIGAVKTKLVGRNFLKGRQLYTVTYTHGYASDPAGKHADTQVWPSSLRMVALQLASRIYDQGIVSSESVGGISSNYATPESIILTKMELNHIEKTVGLGRSRN